MADLQNKLHQLKKKKENLYSIYKAHIETKQVKNFSLDEFDLKAFDFESCDFKELRFSEIFAGCNFQFEYQEKNKTKKIYCAPPQLIYFHTSMYYMKEFLVNIGDLMARYLQNDFQISAMYYICIIY